MSSFGGEFLSIRDSDYYRLLEKITEAEKKLAIAIEQRDYYRNAYEAERKRAVYAETRLIRLVR